jgi:hypothetical protein
VTPYGVVTVLRETKRIRALWPAEFDDGKKCGLKRGKDGYPFGFDKWAADRRNAWLSGFNVGMIEK